MCQYTKVLNNDQKKKKTQRKKRIQNLLIHRFLINNVPNMFG